MSSWKVYVSNKHFTFIIIRNDCTMMIVTATRMSGICTLILMKKKFFLHMLHALAFVFLFWHIHFMSCGGCLHTMLKLYFFSRLLICPLQLNAQMISFHFILLQTTWKKYFVTNSVNCFGTVSYFHGYNIICLCVGSIIGMIATCKKKFNMSRIVLNYGILCMLTSRSIPTPLSLTSPPLLTRNNLYTQTVNVMKCLSDTLEYADGVSKFFCWNWSSLLAML